MPKICDVAFIASALLLLIWVISFGPWCWFRKNRHRKKKPCKHCFECGRKYEQKKKVELLSRMDVKDEQVNQFTVKNEILSDDLEKVSIKLPKVQLQLQKQRQWNEEEQQKNVESFQQVDALSQRLDVKDEQGNEFTVKNKILSEELEKVSIKLPKVQLQLQKQQQWNEEEQQKNVESFQQVELLSQQVKSTDNQLDEMTSRIEALLMDRSHLESKCSELEQQLQEQRKKQEQQDVEYRQQVTQLKTDFQSKDNDWGEVVLKNNETVKAVEEMKRKFEEWEQRSQSTSKKNSISYDSKSLHDLNSHSFHPSSVVLKRIADAEITTNPICYKCSSVMHHPRSKLPPRPSPTNLPP
uniref:putative leucine-rich repeat-containing protein DDB_G0290503 n=1 Tax=Myxine glutinosa TaxID=7769 RepID=UPI00358F7A83